jgi:hypothetical protein
VPGGGCAWIGTSTCLGPWMSKLTGFLREDESNFRISRAKRMFRALFPLSLCPPRLVWLNSRSEANTRLYVDRRARSDSLCRDGHRFPHLYAKERPLWISPCRSQRIPLFSLSLPIYAKNMLKPPPIMRGLATLRVASTSLSFFLSFMFVIFRRRRVSVSTTPS